MYNNNLNPKTISVFDVINSKEFNIIDQEFNILDWVDDKIKNHFTDDEILKVIHDLNITFDDLSNYGQNICVAFQPDNRIVYLPKVYSLTGIKQTKKGKHRLGNYYTTDLYSCSVPNNLINGSITLKLLQNKYPFINKPIYNKTTIVDFNLAEFMKGFSNNIMDIPEKLRSFTIEQLLSLNSISFESSKSNFNIYSDITDFYYKCKISDENIHYPCLHINLTAFLSGDWSKIEFDTRNYYTKYYSSNWSKLEENYPQSKNRMSWIDELLTQPDIQELKIDVLKNKLKYEKSIINSYLL
jgi:hypothetical protein